MHLSGRVYNFIYWSMKSDIRRRRILSAIAYGWGSDAALTPAQIATAFSQRVQSDGGSFESASCLESQITDLGPFFDRASWVAVPNGYSVGKIYAPKPTDGSGDLAFTRTTSGWRKNATLLQEMPINVPRPDYLGASCPHLLMEPARTNLLPRSEDFSNAAWAKTNVTQAEAFDITTLPNLQGANGITVSGDYTFVVANGGNALNIFDSTQKYNPVFLSKITTSGGPIGVIVIGDFAIVSCNTGNCINVFNVADKSNPVLTDTINNGGGINLDGVWNGVYDGSTYLYYGTNTAIQVFSYSNGTLTAISNIAVSVATNVFVVGNFIYYPSFTGDLFGIIDATNKASMSALDTITNGTDGTALDQAHDVVVSADGNTALVCARASNTINVLDTTNKSSIAVISVFTDAVNLVGVESMVWDEANDLLYVVNLTGDDFVILSTANLASLSIVGQLNTNLDGANKVFVSGNYAQIACLDGSLYSIINVTTPASPFLTASISDSNSYKILETTTNATHQVAQTITKALSALPFECEYIAKGGVGRDFICLQADDGTNGQGQFFNLTTGALGGVRTIGAAFTIAESRMIDLGAEGYACIIRGTTSTSATFNFRVLISTDGTTISYAGNTSLGFYSRKSKIILAASPLTDSYITTVASTVARGVDVIPDLTGQTAQIGQTEGTIFFDFESWADGVAKFIAITDGTAANRIGFEITTGNVIRGFVDAASVAQASISNAGLVNFTRYKVALVYRANYAALFVNGTKIGEDLTVTVPACSVISWSNGAGATPFYGKWMKRNLYKTALSDTDAQTLTTI